MYFNEHDKFAANWLRNLFPEAHVDDRDIQNVSAADVAGFRRVHFFGGIGGWELALQLAGWGDAEVWTGSCPCQPLSCAGKRAGEKDERHLWPEFYRLISECRPATIFGEQVASNDGLEWLDGISLDLEDLGYAVATGDLPSAGKGAPMPRQRGFWGAIWLGCTDGAQLGSGRAIERESRSSMSANGSETFGLVCANSDGLQPWESATETARHGSAAVAASAVDRLGSAESPGSQGKRSFEGATFGNESGRLTGLPMHPWDQFGVVPMRDGSYRRASIERGSFPLAYGIPRDLGRRFPELRSLAKSARANRVGRLKGYGNAIVPQVAAVFIRAFMEATA